jgi:hypothetical protein
VELAAEACRELREEARAVGFGRPDLEMRTPRAAQRSRAEQRAAEVGGGTAASGDDAARRAAERPVGAVEHAGPVQRRVSILRALDVELISGRAVESAARVGTDFGPDAAHAEERERPAGDRRARDVEVDIDAAAAAEMRAAGDVKEA